MMVSLMFLGLALFAAAASADNRIIGGVEIRIEQRPSTVQVEARSGNSWTHHCGGTILNPFFILSAAQCFSGSNYNRQNRRIRAGTATRESGGVVRYIIRENNHPTFGRNGFDGDITVVRLADSLNIFHPLDNTIRHSPIMGQNQDLPVNTELNKIGWGATQENGPRAPRLRGVDVRITDFNMCRLNYAAVPNIPRVTENMICATAPGGDACTGDQGGPLFLFHNILVGVISWSHRCAMPGFPGVSTRVASYSNWIVSIINS